jgi:phosphatidylglycerol:prolipoprotein diacylglycerol transferase
VPQLIIQITPDPIAFALGPLSIGWYGIAYVIAIGVLILVTQREVARRGFDPAHVGNAFLLALPLAIIGGRLYHVIHEWDAIYRADPIRAILPPYAGLGLYGGVAGAMLAIFIYVRWKRLPLRIGLDSVVPGTLLAQGIARWGNFFNQELYGPPTNAPWGIAIDCAHRVAQYPCSTFPPETTGFHPLFFYESALDITGGLIALYLSRRYLPRLRPGDIGALWFIWYGAIRSVLETFREGWNWTLGGLATAQWIGIALVIVGVVWIAFNHRPGRPAEAQLPPWQPPEPKPPPEDDIDYQTIYDEDDTADEVDTADEDESADDDIPVDDSAEPDNATDPDEDADVAARAKDDG